MAGDPLAKPDLNSLQRERVEAGLESRFEPTRVHLEDIAIDPVVRASSSATSAPAKTL
jgi:hypothetical protein